jgi:hypothetical protein
MALCARRLAWLRYWRSLVWWQLPPASLQVLHRFPYQLNAVPVNEVLHISEYDFPGVDRWMLFSRESTAAKCAIGNSISLLSMLY